MNKITLALHLVISASKNLIRRASCLLTGQLYDPNPGPQWQQLELPFSRTPVKRWNR